MSTTAIADRIKKEHADVALDAALSARVHEWLAADMDFNTWFLVTTKRTLGDDDLMNLLDGYRESQELASTAWDAFLVDKDADALDAALVASLERMRLLQGRSSSTSAGP